MLIGLMMAGMLHILIPKHMIQRFMGGKGLLSVITSAAFGIPLPICSCGIVPIAIELRRKGASRPSTMSFLITTPESGTDSILITWGLLGPFMAIARPIASFFSALLAGIFAIGLLRDNDENGSREHEDTGCHDHCHGDHEHNIFDNDENYVGITSFWMSVKSFIRCRWKLFIAWKPLNQWYKPDIYGYGTCGKVDKEQNTTDNSETENIPLSNIFKRIWSYAFKEMADEIVFSLLVGLLLAGFIIIAFPDDLSAYGLSKGIIPMLIMLAASVPLYMCASASTPIAAALIIKGISPGAAMVFLLAGPATNATTIVMLTKQFGGRFVRIYLACIIAGALISGYAFDYLLVLTGIHIVPNMSMGTHSIIGTFQWVSALLLIVLIIWRFWNGAAKTGLKDFSNNTFILLLKKICISKAHLDEQNIRLSSLIFKSHLVRIGLPILLLFYIASGLRAVPLGHAGFGVVYGRVVWRDLEPGLHYLPPRPFCRFDVWATKFPKRIVVGLDQTDTGNNTMARTVNTNLHPNSPFANEDWNSEYLTGDENLINTIIVVQYTIPDPYQYYYKTDLPEQIIYQSTRTVAKELIAQHKMLPLFTSERDAMESHIQTELMDHISHLKSHPHKSNHLNGSDKNLMHSYDHGHEKVQGEGVSLGAEILSVNIVDIHPLSETIDAFRSVTSAQESKETSILLAEKTFTMLVPRAIGNAKLEIMRAEALGDAKRVKADANVKAFLDKAAVVSQNRNILQDLLWFETNEVTMYGREKFILPKGVNASKIAIWQQSLNEYPKNMLNDSPKNSMINSNKVKQKETK